MTESVNISNNRSLLPFVLMGYNSGDFTKSAETQR